VYGKTRLLWLPDGEKSLIDIQPFRRNPGVRWTASRTYRRTSCDSIVCAMHIASRGISSGGGGSGQFNVAEKPPTFSQARLLRSLFRLPVSRVSHAQTTDLFSRNLFIAAGRTGIWVCCKNCKNIRNRFRNLKVACLRPNIHAERYRFCTYKLIPLDSKGNYYSATSNNTKLVH